jgi:hypothetical protein
LTPWRGDPQSLNRYAYVENDPINMTDPTGLCPTWGPYISGYELAHPKDGVYTGRCRQVMFMLYGIFGWFSMDYHLGTKERSFLVVNISGPVSVTQLDNPDSDGGGFTLGVRAPGQTYRQCLNVNSSNYSLNTFAGTDNFLLGNDVAQLLFGNRAEGSAGLVFSHGGSLSFEAGVGTAMTAGRRTASITSMNLSGVTGPAPRILAKTGAEELAGWLSGAAELKMAADTGLTGAEAIGCIAHR